MDAAAAAELGVLALIDTAGCGMEEEAEEGGDSRSNPGEARAALAHAGRLLAAGVAPADVGVITPYNAQARRSLTELIWGWIKCIFEVLLGQVDRVLVRCWHAAEVFGRAAADAQAQPAQRSRRTGAPRRRGQVAALPPKACYERSGLAGQAL